MTTNPTEVVARAGLTINIHRSWKSGIHGNESFIMYFVNFNLEKKPVRRTVSKSNRKIVERGKTKKSIPLNHKYISHIFQ
jgi:hypothetical protein